MTTRLRLESLDGRIVPDATPTMPGGTPPVQTPTAQVTATHVATIPMQDAAGNFQNTYAILEKAGSDYVVTFFDAQLMHFYTGTATTDTSLFLAATPELDNLMATYGDVGNIASMIFMNADGSLQNPPTTVAGNPPEALQIGGQIQPSQYQAPANGPRLRPGWFYSPSPFTPYPSSPLFPGLTRRPGFMQDPLLVGPTVQPPPIIIGFPPITTYPPGTPLPTIPGLNPVRPAPTRPNPFGPIGPTIPTPGQFRPDGR